MYCWIFILSISYWYCLPIASTGVFGYTEFRGYDLLLLPGIALMLTTHWSKARNLFRADPLGRSLLYFCAWATIMAVVSLAWNICTSRLVMIGVIGIDLYHLWGFVLAYGAFRIFATKRTHCLWLLDAFLALGLFEAILICFQSIGMAPILWSSRYEVYGDRVFSGTLGMNRTLPGHTMVLLFAVAFTYAYNWRSLGAGRLIGGLIVAIFAMAALLVSGSRTAWLVGIVFVATTFLYRKLAVSSFVTLGMISLAFVTIAPDVFTERVEEMYDYKMTQKLSRAETEDALDQLRAIDSGRSALWIHGIKTIVAHPWILPFGLGFINYSAVDRSGSAHNMYITLIVELGILGLYLYLRCLAAMWQQTASLRIREETHSGPKPRTFFPVGSAPLLASMCVSLLGGEILYVYRPTFAFLGMFLFLFAILNHPALVFGRSPVLSSTRRMTTSVATKPLRASLVRPALAHMSSQQSEAAPARQMPTAQAQLQGRPRTPTRYR
jgi:hypothetical protein